MRKVFSSQNSIGFINFKIVLIHGHNHDVLQAMSCTPRKVVSIRNIQIREIKLVTLRQFIEFGGNNIVIGAMGRNHS